MAELYEEMTSYLLAQSALTALIGRRLSFDDADDKTLPHVVCKEVDNVFNHDMAGKIEIENPNWQFTVYAASRPSAKAVGKALKAALSDFSGTLGGIPIQWIRLRNEIAGKEMIGDTAEAHTLDQEYEINFINKE